MRCTSPPGFSAGFDACFRQALAVSPAWSGVNGARPQPALPRVGELAELRPFAAARQAPLSMRATSRQREPLGHAESDMDPARIDLAAALWNVELPRDDISPRLDAATLDTQRRQVLACMLACSTEAYSLDVAKVPGIGGFRLAAAWSSRTMKLWVGRSHPNVCAMVLGFSGTRMEDRGDVLCALKGQVPTPHANPLGDGLHRLGWVGSGWQERWHAEAQAVRGGEGKRMADILAGLAAQARASGKALSVSVVGHSLGATVATLAGFDIANFLSHRGERGKVSIHAFNPPRLGIQASGRYLQAFEAAAMQQDGALQLSLRQFTRELDPVQSLPFFMQHAGWTAGVSRGDEYRHAAQAASHVRVATYNDRASSRIDLSGNHELSDWKSVFVSDMSAASLRRLFVDDEPKPAGPPDGLRFGRRQLLLKVMRLLPGQGVRPAAPQDPPQ